jgi:serine/threonine protein kinase/WD40 repeat protein
MTTSPPDDDATVREPFDPLMSAAGKSSPPSAIHGALPSIEGFQLVRLLGEGGMGTVYEAWQEKPRRRVALKLVRPGVMSDALLKRFSLEVDVLGRLEHPAIGRIYAAGTAVANGAGQPYFAMEYIEGVPVTAYAQQENLTTRQRVSLLLKVVDGVHHAHQKGVIHRDLKPANILVTTQGDPKILDFGVARVTDSDVNMTTIPTDIGILVGTLQYMSPEQATGDVNELDTRTDVYSLGVIAFEVLTGGRPYHLDKKLIHEAARIIRETEPTRISSFNKTLRGDVETIVNKALEKSKDHRYSSASALSADLERYLNDQPISARPPSVGYQIAKFTRRHKLLVASSAAILLSILAGGIAATIGMVRAQRAELVAEASRESEEKLRIQAEYDGYVASIAAAANYIENGEYEQASLLLEGCPERYRHWEWHRLNYLMNMERLTISPNQGALARMRLSDDGRRLYTVSVQGGCRVWDMTTGDLLHDIDPPSVTPNLADVAPSVDYFAMVFGNELRVRSVTDGTLLWTATIPVSPSGLRFSRDGSTIAVAGSGGILLYNAHTGEGVLSQIMPPRRGWLNFAVSPDAMLVVQNDFYGTTMWSLKDGSFITDLDTGTREMPMHIEFAPDGSVVYLTGQKGVLYEFNLAGNLLRESQGHSGLINSLQVLDAGEIAVTSSSDGSAVVWEMDGLTPVRRIRGHRGGIGQVTASSDGKVVVTWGGQGLIKVWEDDAAQEVIELGRLPYRITQVAMNEDATTAVVAAEDWVHVWDLGSHIKTWEYDFRRYISSLSLHPATHQLAVGAFSDFDAKLYIIDYKTAEVVQEYTREGNQILSAAYSPDGTLLIDGASYAMAIRATESWNIVRDVPWGAYKLAWFPDGRRLLVLTKNARIWDWEENTVLWNGPAHGGSSGAAMAVSPDGRQFLFADRIRDSTTSEEIHQLAGHGGGVRCAAFSSDGKRLATGGDDSTIRIWDTTTGRILLSLRGHDGSVQAVHFSSDNTRLLSGGNDGRVLLWDSRERSMQTSAPPTKILQRLSNKQPAITLATIRQAPVVDGRVEPGEYGLTAPLFVPDDDNGFGDDNALGDFFAAQDGTNVYIGLRGATLDENMTNGILVFISSPKLDGGWQNPAWGFDPGEPGDSPGLPVAESLLTRGPMKENNGWFFPSPDFVDVAFGLIDTGVDQEAEWTRTPRATAGLYKFAAPNGGFDLGHFESRYAWRDRGPGVTGGLEFVVPFSALGGVGAGDTIELVAFLARADGYTSNETLPGELLSGENPGYGFASFTPASIKLIIRD